MIVPVGLLVQSLSPHVGVMVDGSCPRITMRSPIASVHLSIAELVRRWHMLPEDTTRTGNSVLRATLTPAHIPIAPKRTTPTRNRPLAVSFLRR